MLSGFRRDIQGMRAVAIVLVVVFHAGAAWLPGGFVGVDVFFVISGFLITSHLLAERSANGRISLARFYARRVRRLLPASLLVLAATLALVWVFWPPLVWTTVAKDGVFASLYAANLWFAYRSTDYLADLEPSVFQHYWSLGVEEQFYALWPLAIILVAAVFRRRPVLAVGVAVAAASAASLALSYVLTPVNQPLAFFTLPTRLWEFGVGAGIALAAGKMRGIPPRAAGAAGAAGLALIAGAALLLDKDTAYPGVAALVPVAGAALLIAAGLPGARPTTPSAAAALLSAAPLQFLGRISYSLYLWHWPLLVIPSLYTATPPSAVETIGLVALAVALATLTERYVERPFLARRGSDPTPARALAAAGVAALLLPAACVAVLAKPALTSDRPAEQWARQALPTAVADPGYVPANLVPPLREAATDVPRIYDLGCHADVFADTPAVCRLGKADADRSIVLFGDSHAAQWFDPLEKVAMDAGYALYPVTKSGCPSADIPVYDPARGVTGPECARWRAAALDLIGQLQPEVVVVSNHHAYRNVDDARWTQGVRSLLRALPATAKVYVIADTPTFGVAPAVCLSENLDSSATCAGNADEIYDKARIAAEQAAARELGAHVVQTQGWLCDGGTCPAIRGDVLVYSDTDHITVEYARRLSALLAQALDLPAAD